MGEVYKFPNRFPLESQEEIDAIEQARGVMSDSTREATINSESLAIGPALKRQIDNGEGEWRAVRLSDKKPEPPKLRIVQG